MSAKSRIPVLIVGAGPVGLTMALWLRKKNIKFRIIDKTQSYQDTSRAVIIQPRILEFYNQLGIADELIRSGNLIPDVQINYKNNFKTELTLGDFGSSISQYSNPLTISKINYENILIEKLKSLSVAVEKQTELVNLMQNKFTAEAVLKSKSGEECVNANYVCGCDGAGSTTRQLLGIKFNNSSSRKKYFLADFSTRGEHKKNYIQFNIMSKGYLIGIPLNQEEKMQIIGIVPTENENKENLSFVNLSDYIHELSGLNIEKINSFSTYNTEHRIASHFRYGRVFLVGDAAHSHNPTICQSMNAGIGDAVNLAWKLSAVLSGEASVQLLDTYEEERINYAENLKFMTDNVFSFITNKTYIRLAFTSLIIPNFLKIATHLKPLLRLIFKTISQINFNYRESLLSSGTESKVKAGDRLPWLMYPSGSNYENLKSMDWQIHIYGKTDEKFMSVSNFRGFKIYQFDWDKNTEAAGFIKDAFYLVRPDGYIGLIEKKQNTEFLKNYLNKWDIDYSQSYKKDRYNSDVEVHV